MALLIQKDEMGGTCRTRENDVYVLNISLGKTTFFRLERLTLKWLQRIGFMVWYGLIWLVGFSGGFL
jgi:hypothetical protein